MYLSAGWVGFFSFLICFRFACTVSYFLLLVCYLNPMSHIMLVSSNSFVILFGVCVCVLVRFCGAECWHVCVPVLIMAIMKGWLLFVTAFSVNLWFCSIKYPLCALARLYLRVCLFFLLFAGLWIISILFAIVSIGIEWSPADSCAVFLPTFPLLPWFSLLGGWSHRRSLFYLVGLCLCVHSCPRGNIRFDILLRCTAMTYGTVFFFV